MVAILSSTRQPSKEDRTDCGVNHCVGRRFSRRSVSARHAQAQATLRRNREGRLLSDGAIVYHTSLALPYPAPSRFARRCGHCNTRIGQNQRCLHRSAVYAVRFALICVHSRPFRCVRWPVYRVCRLDRRRDPLLIRLPLRASVRLACFDYSRTIPRYLPRWGLRGTGETDMWPRPLRTAKSRTTLLLKIPNVPPETPHRTNLGEADLALSWSPYRLPCSCRVARRVADTLRLEASQGNWHWLLPCGVFLFRRCIASGKVDC